MSGGTGAEDETHDFAFRLVLLLLYLRSLATRLESALNGVDMNSRVDAVCGPFVVTTVVHPFDMSARHRSDSSLTASPRSPHDIAVTAVFVYRQMSDGLVV